MTAVVLAGGRSTRFGRDKLRQPYRGFPLVHHAILAVVDVAAEVLVVGAPGRPPDLPSGVPLLLQEDAREGEGPLAALSGALANVHTPLALVVGGDMPGLAREVLLELLRVADEADADAVALQDGERFRPLPVVLRLRRARPIAAGLVRSGERRLRTLLDALRVAVVDEPTWRALDPSGRTLFDVDTPDDLADDTARNASEGHGAAVVGAIEVVPVCEGFAPLALEDELPGTDVDWNAERRRNPWAFLDEASWPWHVHAFAVRTAGRLVLIDSGLGSFGPYRPWAAHTDREAALARAGVGAEDVADVVLTHLHADHAGGVATDEGAPRFPNARVHVHAADRRHFEAKRNEDGYDAADGVAALDRLGLVSTTDADHEVARHVRAVHTPGHTPGHRSVVIEDGDERLLVTGDLLHIPAQVRASARPSSHDEDRAVAARSRAEMLERARRGGWLVGVSHFARPFGRVDGGHGAWRSAMP